MPKTKLHSLTLHQLTYSSLCLLINTNRNCEFLNKLDLTVNFVDLDELEASATNLQQCHCLKDLYMMGNPAQSWEKFNAYMIARLPQLKTLDGVEIIKSMRISACQQLPAMEVS
jgi:protein TilB